MNMLKKILNISKYILVTLSILIAIILAFHSIMIMKYKDFIPSVGHYTYFNVLSQSMSPVFEPNDIVVGKKIKKPDELQIGDIITYIDGRQLVTHRIKEIKNESGALSFVTKGDYNPVEDVKETSEDLLVSKYLFRIPFAGIVVAKFQDPMFLFLLWLISIYWIVEKLYKEVKNSKNQKQNNAN